MELQTALDFEVGALNFGAVMPSSENSIVVPVIQPNATSDLDPRYLGFFDCFNRQLFFEAHEVLEELWLAERGKSKGLFYKGLIQLAGAFVHVQKERWQPAMALFELARKNLLLYAPGCEGLDIAPVVELIGEWVELLKPQFKSPRRGSSPAGI